MSHSIFCSLNVPHLDVLVHQKQSLWLGSDGALMMFAAELTLTNLSSIISHEYYNVLSLTRSLQDSCLRINPTRNQSVVRLQ